MRRGVYRMAGAPETWEQRLLGVMPCGGARSSCVVPFCGSALADSMGSLRRARDHRAGRQTGGAPRGRGPRTNVFDPRHVVRVTDVPVTSVARTLCDLTAVVAHAWSSNARSTKHCGARRFGSTTSVETPHERLEGRGRASLHGHAGDPRSSHALATTPARAHPEARIAELLMRAGLPEPTMQHRVEINGEALPHRPLLPGRSDRDRVRRVGVPPRSTVVRRGPAHEPMSSCCSDSTVLRFTSKSSDQAIVDTVARRRCERASRQLTASHAAAYFDRCSEMGGGAGQVMQSAPRRMRSSA